MNAYQIMSGYLAEFRQSVPQVTPAQLGYSDNDRPSMITSLLDGGVGVIRVHGGLQRRKSWWRGSYEVLQSDLDYLAGNAGVAAVVLDVDSPGGMAVGIAECSQMILDFPKPIVAVATGYCCSAAYRLAACCDQVIATVDAELGSIGTIIQMDDYSKAFEIAGVKHLDFVTGWAKGIGTVGSEVTQDQRDYMQRWSERLQTGFAADLENRLTASQIATVSTGECWGAEDAVRLRLADGISTLPDVVNQLTQSPKSFSVRPKQEIEMKNLSQSVVPAPAASVQTQEAPAVSPLQSVTGTTPVTPTQSATPAGVAPDPEPAAVAPAPTQAVASPVAPAPVQAVASPVATPAQAEEVPAEEVAATYQQIVEACQGHQPSPEFIVRMQEAGATQSVVARTFVDELIASQAVATAPAGDQSASLSMAGGGGGGTVPGGDPSDPVQSVEDQIDALIADGMPRMVAARQVLQTDAAQESFRKGISEMSSAQKAARRERNNHSRLGRGSLTNQD